MLTSWLFGSATMPVAAGFPFSNRCWDWSVTKDVRTKSNQVVFLQNKTKIQVHK